MQISLTVSPRGPVSVIPEIPDSRLAVLQGYNGIGKSMAFRLLQVLTGVMPYPETSDSWQSFRLALGSGTVTASELTDGSTISWYFDSEDWLDLSPPINDSWFTSLQIGGSDSTLEDVRRKVTVHRLAGDENRIETLALQIDAR